jgi:hypothetical protein
MKKKNGKLVYWECPNCGYTKQKDWGLPWLYIPSDSASYLVFKSPPCKALTKDGLTSSLKTEGGEG